MLTEYILPEYILLIVTFVSLMFHLRIGELHAFFCLNLSPVVFGLLSLVSIDEKIHEETFYSIINYIMTDNSEITVLLNFILYFFCIWLICYNLYVFYRYD